MEFRVLGPLEVVADSRSLVLGGVKQRAVLALLVVQAGRVVSTDRLIEGVWPGRAPDSAGVTLRGYVSRLRSVLEPKRFREAAFQVLVTRNPGYVLQIDLEQLDAARFEQLVREGSAALEAGDPDLAEARLRAGLSMWRGPALAEFADAAFARGEIARLEELRLVATETMIAADLALGRHAGLVGELEALVAAHPLREGLRGQLMLALYRAGRQADALGAYHDVRALLADELGIDPSAELQRLHEAILVQKSELDWVPPDPGRASRPARAPTAGRMPAPGPSSPRGVFVGRDVEVARLWGALADVRAGQGRLVLVGGEPGIGKTSIARNLADQAQAAGMAVLWGRVWEADGAPPFWPWVQILRSWMQTCEPGRLGQALASDAAVIAQLVPRVAERLPGLADPPELPAAQARFRLFDAVTGVLKRVAGARPLVVVLDDLHRADVPSLRLLQFLARELADAHLLVVGTFRDAKADLDEVVVGVLAELGREPVTCRMRLEGLSGEHVGHFVERVTGLDVSPVLVAKLCVRTGGNPLFLHQLVQPLAEGADLVRFEEEFDERVPQQALEVVRWWLERLPAQARTVLTAASVIGPVFDLAVLHAVSGLEVGLLVELVEQAVGLGVVAEMPTAVGRYRFCHVLVRDALYRQLGARRAGLHHQVGEALEGLYAGDLEPRLAELASHFVQAADAAKALAYLTRAGQRALALLAYEEAARLFALALALDQYPDEARRCELLLALADAQMRAGDMASAQETLLGAAGGARALGDPQRLARAALGFKEILIDFTLLFVGAVERVVGLLEEALALLDAGDSPLRAQMLGHLAMTLAQPHYWQPDAERRRAARERSMVLSQQAVAMARRLGDTKVLASVLDTRCSVLGLDTFQELLELAAEILTLAKAASDKEMAQQARMWRIVGFLQLGDVPATDAELGTYIRVAEELRQPVYLYWAHIWRSTRALMAGRFDVAERHNLQALGFGRRLQRLDVTQLQAGVGAQLFLLRKEQGRLDELDETVRGFVRKFPHVPGWRAALALIRATAGDEEAARWEFERLAAKDFTLIPRDAVWLVTVALAAEVCALLGDARRAVMLYELLLPFAHHCVVLGRAYSCLGSVAHFLGQLAATMGDVEAACRHFEVALEVNARIGATPHLAHTQYHCARALLARGLPGDRETANALRGQALRTARALGMPPLIQQASSQPPPDP
ncbi:MAG: BTAD domain-containing putative transcriptional regulator [Egibacteraceae bacterium]